MAVKQKCKKAGKILVLEHFSMKQLCGTISIVLTVTINVFSPHAILMSYICIKCLFGITQALIYVEYRSLSVMNGEWVIM